jgi:hypothetical protein
MAFNDRVYPGDMWCVEASRERCHVFLCGDIGRFAIPKLLERVSQKIDCVYTDPPWDKGKMTYYANLAGIQQKQREWHKFVDSLLKDLVKAAIPDIWIEMGVGTSLVINLMQSKSSAPPYDNCWGVLYDQTKQNTLIHFGHSVAESADGLKGLQVPRFAFQHMRPEAKVVLDPCVGKGTTAKVAHTCAKSCYGIELVPARLQATMEWFAKQKDVERIYRVGRIQ